MTIDWPAFTPWSALAGGMFTYALLEARHRRLPGN